MSNSSSSLPCSTAATFDGDSGGSACAEFAAGSVVTTSKNAESKRLQKLSHALSWLLRHKAREFHLPISDDGYVPVEACLACSHPKFSGRTWTVDDVRAVVETSDKKRFKLDERCASAFYPATSTKRSKRGTAGDGDGDNNESDNDHCRRILCIRANQGHSISGIDADRLLTRLTPDELAGTPIVVHGTYAEVWEKHIQSEGLKCMERNHIHFAAGIPPPSGAGNGPRAVVSGMRKSCQVHIYVHTKKCAQDGITFYRSDNGVLLTTGINGTLPTAYFSHVTNAEGTILVDRRPSPTSDDSTTKEDVTGSSEP